MAFLDWLARTMGRDLDKRVVGSEGQAHARFQIPLGAGTLMARAKLGAGHQGTLELNATSVQDDDQAEDRSSASNENSETRHERAEGELSVDLGRAKRWKGAELTLDAQVTGVASETLATLQLELIELDPDSPTSPPLGRETYSVEGRPDARGQAHLSLIVSVR